MSSNDKSTIYENAFIYDQIHSPLAEGKDLSFYRNLCKDKKVLEIACGSGRLTIPLAQQGIEILGLDLSQSMLSEAKEKAKNKNLSIEWIQADCTEFALNQTFDVIFMTGNSLQHLKTKEQVYSYFECVKRHLTPQGIFAFDIFRPSISILNRDPNTRFFVTKYTNRDGAEISLEESNQYDVISQINTIQWFHVETSEKIQKIDILEMRQFFPQEILLLLQLSDFKLKNYYGDWDLNPPSQKNFKQIFVTQRT